MSLAILESVVLENHGGLFDYGQNGLLILDRTGKRMIHVCRNDVGGMDAACLDAVRSFFTETEKCTQECRSAVQIPKAHINGDLDLLSGSRSSHAFISAVGALRETHDVTLRFHFDRSPPSWRRLWEQHVDFFKKDHHKNPFALQIYGPFTQMTDADKDFLFDQNSQLFFVHDSVVFSHAVRKTALDLAEYGFQVPFVWHVHKENVKQIPNIMDEALALNHHSGFSLPLIDECFYKKTLPSPLLDDYLKLLIHLYSTYPFYDRVFYPLRSALDASLAAPTDPKPMMYRWNMQDSILAEIFPSHGTEQTRSFWTRAFLWQRWSVYNMYHDAALIPSIQQPNKQFNTQRSNANFAN